MNNNQQRSRSERLLYGWNSRATSSNNTYETEHNQNDSARDPKTTWTNSKQRRIPQRRYGDFCYISSTTHESYENVSNSWLEMLSQYRYEVTTNETWKTHLRSKRTREREESIREMKGLIGMKKQMRWMQDQEEWYEHENDCNEERKCVLNLRRHELRTSRTPLPFPIRSPTYLRWQRRFDWTSQRNMMEKDERIACVESESTIGLEM